MAGPAFDFDALPKMQVAAACLFFDDQGRVLVVKPTYKPGWEAPGGAADEGESPLEACRREVQEELGLDVWPVRLLAVDYLAPAPGRRGNGLRFVFLGPKLEESDLEQIELQRAELSEWRFMSVGELSEWRFMSVGELMEDLPATRGRRLKSAVDRRLEAAAAYLEEGRVILR